MLVQKGQRRTVGFASTWAESYSRGVGCAKNLVLAARGNENRAGGADTYDYCWLAGTCLGQDFLFRRNFEIVSRLPPASSKVSAISRTR